MTFDDLYGNNKPSGASATSSGNPLQNILQGASGIARDLGLGIIPDVAGAAYGLIPGLYETAKQSLGQETPQDASQYLNFSNSNPFTSPSQIAQNYENLPSVANSAGKDIAGAASWTLPEIEIMKAGEGANLGMRLLSGLINRGVQGIGQGGLNAISQGQNPVEGGLTGAGANVAMSGAGNLLTDALPRYIGLRNFGKAGANLPEVVKAESAAGAIGDTLKGVRNDVMANIQPFELNPQTSGGQTDRFGLMQKIQDLADQPEWKGTPGLSELVKGAKNRLPYQQGALPDLESVINNSNDMFDAYSQIKNMAYPKDNSPASTRLSAFLHSAANTTREHLINTSENPNATRQAMDDYANQVAMGKGGRVGGKGVLNAIGDIAAKGGGEAGLAGLSMVLPALSGAALPLAADAILSNPVTGLPIARGLVGAGQNQGLDFLLRRLGISGAQGIANAVNPANATQ